MDKMRRILKIAPALGPVVLAALPVIAHADTGVGVDLWRSLKLDPTGGQLSRADDADGTSWLHPGQSRTPTGNLYLCPKEVPVDTPDEEAEEGDWTFHGIIDAGFLHFGGEKTALFDRYTRYPTNGFVIQDLDLNFVREADGSYADIHGSRISDEDQYFEAVYGKAGAYRVKVFMRDIPNLLSTDAKSIWNGVGTNNLTLVAGLTPGATSNAVVAAVDKALPTRNLEVDRDKEGLGASGYLTPEWTAYGDVSYEKRKGARPYGGAFFFPMFGLGAAVESIKPINDSTLNINAGVRYASPVWRYDLGYSGSYYRDDWLRYTFTEPFALGTPVVPGAIASPISQGQMSMEPDNQYHLLRGTATRVVPLNGEWTLSASEGEMRQNAALIPPIDCSSTFGFGFGNLNLGPQNPQLFPCSQWNTSAALSQKTADMLIVTTMGQTGLMLRPTNEVTINSGLKFYREEYRNQYLAYNPENGDYGYPAENGAEGSLVPGPQIYNPVTYPAAADVQVRSNPLSWASLDAFVGATYKLTPHDTVGALLDFNRYSPQHREVSYDNDYSIRLNWTNKSLDWLTFRGNYTFLRQDSSTYNPNPYAFLFFQTLPGFNPALNPIAAWTVDQMRKLDVGDRVENKIDFMATFIPRRDMTVTASLRGDYNAYPTVIGLASYNTFAALVNWEWQFTETSSFALWAGLDHANLRSANVNDNGTQQNQELGGAEYPLANRWWVDDNERNDTFGAQLTHDFGSVRLDASWSYLYSVGLTGYTYASPSALAYPASAPEDGNGFPPMTYSVNTLTLSLTFPLTKSASLRLFDSAERGREYDWHYAGFNNSLTYFNAVYADPGPQDYNANLIGIFLNYKL